MNPTEKERPIVVGVGASAGGLDAISRFLKGVPDDSGMSFVIIQHLDPTHKSALVEILKRRTGIPIRQVEEDTEIEPNHIYVIPPGQYLSIEECVLKLSEPQDPRGSRMAIDYFLRSLAEDQCEYGIGIVLSGTGTDGTAGLQEIKHYGGLTVVQDPAEAEHDGMPRSAIDAVHIDYVLPAEQIGGRLKRYVDFCHTHGPLSAQSAAQSETVDLSPILDLLRKETKHDFRRYRKNTLMRRVQRRMGLHQLDQLAEYRVLLADNAKEREALRCDLLIGVTRFYRDHDAWEILEKKVVRPMMAEQDRRQPIRVWSAGCATGEEAYSIAMMLHEQIAVNRRKPPFQIFATDVADDALAFARNGLYPDSIMKDVPLERLRRFFKKEPGGYRVSKQLRESVVFANQNVLAQPPFAKLDLILCRNLLIYLQREAQERVMSVFQFALKEGGVLFQGSTETVGGMSDLFTPISKKWRISRRTGTKSWPPVGGSLAANVQPLPEFSAVPRPDREQRGDGLAGLVQRQIFQQLDRAVVVVNQDNHVLFAEGRSDLYLQFKSGEYSAELPDVMDVARKGLKAKLRAELRKAWKSQSGTPSQTFEARVHRDGGIHRCQIQIDHLQGRPADEPAMMLVFTPLENVVPPLIGPTDHLSAASDSGQTLRAAESRSIATEQTVMELEHELTTTREQLQSSIAELEAANEELKASNEEAMTMNEEMQSSNEELETSKEELQSLNEELTTLNNQLEIKVEELEDTTNDLENLLTSSDVPTVFLDTQFRIRRYTPSCADLFSFIAGDVGRPLSDIKAHFDDPELHHDAQSVLRDLQPCEKLVTSSDGQRRFRRRMLPYRTDDHRIQGVVMTLTDITDLLEAQEQAQRQLAQIQSIYASAPVGLAFVDRRLRYISINQRLAEIDGVSVADHLGKTIQEVLPAEFADQVCAIYRKVLETGEGVYEQEIIGQTERGSEDRVYLVSYVPVTRDDGEVLGVNAVVQDITDRKRAEIELVDREAHLRRVIDHQLGFVGVLDTQGTLIEVGASALERAGLVRDDVIGKKFWECYWWNHDDDVAQQLRQAIDRAFAGETVRYDVPVRMAGDTRIMIDFMLCPVRDQNGTVTHLIPSAVDISDRHGAQAELHDKEELLRMALRAGGMAAWEWTPQQSHWEPELYDLLGISHDTEASTPQFFKSVHPEDLRGLEEAWQRATEGDEKYYHEFRIVRPDGEIRWLVGTGRVYKNDDGRVDRIYGLNWDITDQKQREELIRDSELRFRAMANAAPAMIWVTDENNDCTFLSRAWVEYTGQAEQDGLGQGWLQAVHSDDRETTFRTFQTAAAQREPFELDYRLQTAVGDHRWAIVAGKPHFDDNQRFVGYVGSVIDADERHQVQESLKEAQLAAEAANESKSAFLANMSHEIRTPMTAILGYAELMSKLVEHDEARKCLRTIRRNGDFLLGIINDILDLSKIEANKFEVDFQRFNPADVVEDVRSIMDIRATENALDLEIEYRGKVPAEIESDPKRLKQILINLVGNAIKFTKEGGVNVAVTYDAGKLLFQITDSGIGIPTEQKERLFQPFSQGDHSVNREFGGTGLGLTISSRLATMLGGEIHVESEEGRGSTFAVAIAVGDTDEVELVKPRTTITPSVVDHHPEPIKLDCHVLIVDDRRDIRFLTRRFLSDAGATVQEAEDGEAALDIFKLASNNGEAFDLILLDMQMPRLDGYAAAKELRHLGFTSPIIALTADAMQGDMSKCIEAGCNDYLSKPIDKIRLLETVKRFSL